MFFYHDPDEINRRQAEEATAKAAAATARDAEPTAELSEWDVSAAPQAGGIDPMLAPEGGE